MEPQTRTFIPAAGHELALPFYDPLVRLIGGDRVRRVLLERAVLAPGQRVLDVGCGTGTLVVWIKERNPQVEVVGLDPDPRALGRSARKAERARVSVQLDRGFGDALPYETASFDHVFSSLMLHHLTAAEKERTLREVRRVLKPRGSFHLLDFVTPSSGAHGGLHGLLHKTGLLHDRANAALGALLQSAGFVGVEEVTQRSLLMQRVVYFRAVTPA